MSSSTPAVPADLGSTASGYYAPYGGHPPQTDLLTDRAMFKEAYAVIPRGTQRDIVTSFLPHWEGTRLWVLARPLTGFAETFSQYLMEVSPGGGSEPIAVERVIGEKARGQLVGVQIPALVVPALQGPVDQSCVQRPGLAALGGVAHGQLVGGTVREVHTGSGHRHLHDVLGKVRGRVLHGLELRGDAQGRRVVVGAVVQ